MENKRGEPAVHLDKELTMRVLNMFVTVGIFRCKSCGTTMLVFDVRILPHQP